MPQSQKTLTKKAVTKVKSAPKKIVEHALNTAIKTVEKAAETEVKRTHKKAQKTAKKLEKAQKIARVAENEAKRANTLSHKIGKLNTIAEKPKKLTTKVKGVIKEKIQDIMAPQKEVEFYYDRRQLVVLTALYALLAVFVYIISNCLLMVKMYDSFTLLGFLIATQILTLAALVSVLFVTIVPQRLAYINKDGIKIDHNEMLRWSDIECAEEKYTSFISRRPFMALHLKPGAIKNYRLMFMQKLCKKNIFTPFSIPMYAMRPEDSASIRDIIKRHAKYEDNRN